MYGIVGAKHAHMDNFNYSDALKALHDKPWNAEELFHFLNNPKGYVKGTKMAFAGIKSPEDLANLIAYLNSNSDAPKALPKDLKVEIK
jgi:cytochrome c